jgi:hypothetical protein
MDELHDELNLKSRVAGLYAYIAQCLKIKKTPKLTFTNNPTNAKNPYGFTGYYNNKDNSIRVFPTDILRSFAHEVIHHWQNERGQLGNDTGEHYTQNDPHLRKKEMEAYLLGNILFRDWQDEQRYGPPEENPFLMTINENVVVTDPMKLKDIIKWTIDHLIANNIIATYNRDLSSGQMKAEDFAEEFATRISSELQSQIQRINDKGNWENQPQMVK